jgi:hypothetical protein
LPERTAGRWAERPCRRRSALETNCVAVFRLQQTAVLRRKSLRDQRPSEAETDDDLAQLLAALLLLDKSLRKLLSLRTPRSTTIAPSRADPADRNKPSLSDTAVTKLSRLHGRAGIADGRGSAKEETKSEGSEG